MLTCYSALLFLLHVYAKHGTVTVADAKSMVGLTPTQRMEWLADPLRTSGAIPKINELLRRYEHFLSITSASEEELIGLFQDDSEAHKLRDEQSAFGDLAYEILYSVGHQSNFYRRLVV